MRVGVVFASTGGQKIVRALRSFRRTEPELPVHIALDVSSRTWNMNYGSPPLSWLEQQPDVRVRCITNTAHINGILNAAMLWMVELGYDYGCLFHDDVVFSSLPEHYGHLSEWFRRLSSDSRLQKASALTLSYIQAFVPGVWRRSPAEWDLMDLESESLWRILCPDGRPAGYLNDVIRAHEEHPPGLSFFVQYYCVEGICRWLRLGPSGQIVPVAVWNSIGGFDERDGIFYDTQYPAECLVQKLAPILLLPNVPHLHLHNQTIGYGDPASGLWSNTMGAFNRKYGEYFGDWGTFVQRYGKNFEDWRCGLL